MKERGVTKECARDPSHRNLAGLSSFTAMHWVLVRPTLLRSATNLWLVITHDASSETIFLDCFVVTRRTGRGRIISRVPAAGPSYSRKAPFIEKGLLEVRWT